MPTNNGQTYINGPEMTNSLGHKGHYHIYDDDRTVWIPDAAPASGGNSGGALILNQAPTLIAGSTTDPNSHATQAIGGVPTPGPLPGPVPTQPSGGGALLLDQDGTLSAAAAQDPAGAAALAQQAAAQAKQAALAAAGVTGGTAAPGGGSSTTELGSGNSVVGTTGGVLPPTKVNSSGQTEYLNPANQAYYTIGPDISDPSGGTGRYHVYDNGTKVFVKDSGTTQTNTSDSGATILGVGAGNAHPAAPTTTPTGGGASFSGGVVTGAAAILAEEQKAAAAGGTTSGTTGGNAAPGGGAATTHEYTVQAGQSLSSIAAANGDTLAEVEKLNPQYGSNFGLIHAGDKVTLPGGGSQSTSTGSTEHVTPITIAVPGGSAAHPVDGRPALNRPSTSGGTVSGTDDNNLILTSTTSKMGDAAIKELEGKGVVPAKPLNMFGGAVEGFPTRSTYAYTSAGEVKTAGESIANAGGWGSSAQMPPDPANSVMAFENNKQTNPLSSNDDDSKKKL